MVKHYCQIRIQTQTRKALNSRGVKNETYDEIIVKMIRVFDKMLKQGTIEVRS